jgi:hypothetical protein
MFTLESRAEKLAALLLALLMAATRVHHFGVGAIAPDASTAVYFLAGLALVSPWWLLAFLAEAVLLDSFAIGVAGVADACISGGYVLLAPAYGALWLAGRAMRKSELRKSELRKSELRKSERLDWLTAGKFVCAITGGVAAFFVIANIGYFFGSEFYALGVPEYTRRVSRYFSYYETVTLFYAAAGIAALALAARLSGREKLAAR